MTKLKDKTTFQIVSEWEKYYDEHLGNNAFRSLMNIIETLRRKQKNDKKDRNNSRDKGNI